MDFLSTKIIIKTDQRYSEYYSDINHFSGLDTASIFLMCVIIGYKANKMSDDLKFGDKSKEFRGEYFDDIGKSILYTIADNITDGKMFDDWDDDSLKNEIIKKFQRYSNAGMDILINDAFSDNMTDGKFRESYDNYDLDLTKYLYDGLNVKVPF